MSTLDCTLGRPARRDSGLVNLRARQYEPGTGRFTAIDPLTTSARVPSARSVSGPAEKGIRLDDIGGLFNSGYLAAVFRLHFSASRIGDISRLLNPIDLETYGYANGDPVDLSDPRGLEAEEEAIEVEIADATVEPAWKLGTVAACEAKFDYDLYRCAESAATNMMYSENTLEAELALCYGWAIRQYVLCLGRTPN